jgi:hypothetical protein
VKVLLSLAGAMVLAASCSSEDATEISDDVEPAAESSTLPPGVTSGSEVTTSPVAAYSDRTAIAWVATSSPSSSLPDCPMTADPLVDELSGLLAEDFSLSEARLLDSADAATATPRAICSWLGASGQNEISVNLAVAPEISRSWVDDLFAAWAANGDLSSTSQETEWRALLDGEQREGFEILGDPGKHVCYATWVIEGAWVEAMYTSPGDGDPTCMENMRVVMTKHVEELVVLDAD